MKKGCHFGPGLKWVKVRGWENEMKIKNLYINYTPKINNNKKQLHASVTQTLDNFSHATGIFQ